MHPYSSRYTLYLLSLSRISDYVAIRETAGLKMKSRFENGFPSQITAELFPDNYS